MFPLASHLPPTTPIFLYVYFYFLGQKFSSSFFDERGDYCVAEDGKCCIWVLGLRGSGMIGACITWVRFRYDLLWICTWMQIGRT